MTSSANIFKRPLKNEKKLEMIFFRPKRSCVVEVVANCNCAQMTKEEREILLASSAARGHYSEVSFCYSESSSSPSSSSSQLLQYWVKSTLHRAGEFRTTIRLGASVAIARREEGSLEMRAFVCANSNTFGGKSLPRCFFFHLLLLQFPRL